MSPGSVGVRALRVPFQDLAPGRQALSGALLHYVRRVHRLGPGDRLALFDPLRGVEADAEIVALGHDGLACEIGSIRPSDYRAYPISLLQGLAKGSKPDWTIREATALGVARVVFVESERAVVRLPPERVASRHGRWQRIAAEASRQCGRGDIPALEGPLPLLELLDRTPEPRRLLLAANGAPLLERVSDWQSSERVALLVGPEGGFSPPERERAERLGFLPASIGRTTLRTELAGVAAVGALVAFAALRGIG